MDDKLNTSLTTLTAQDKLGLQKTKIALKKTSLLIDELELRREEEKEFKLTTPEQNQYERLQMVFGQKRPSKDIKSAINDERELKNIRKDFLTASKLQRECQALKERADNDSLGVVLLAASIPVGFIGFTLLDAFAAAGIGVMVAGATMSIPFFISEATKKKKTRKELKKINAQVYALSNEIDKRSANIDEICTKYNLPVNCLDREQYMSPLLDAALEYESLQQKEADYEMLLQLHGADILSKEISKNLKILSGIDTKDEQEYHTIMKLLEEQFQNISSNALTQKQDIKNNAHNI